MKYTEAKQATWSVAGNTAQGLNKAPGELNSALYRGRLWHERRSPKHHSFSYPLYMIYLDLDEIDEVLQCSSFLSKKHLAALQFCERDFHGRAPGVKQRVLKTVKQQCGLKLDGPVRMLSSWRSWGFNFNPLTTYYCFDKGDVLRAIVAEVSNTPWLERRAYVLKLDDAQRDGAELIFAKDFTVSPFNHVNMNYHWSSSEPGETIEINIDLSDAGESFFSAALNLQREALTAKTVRKTLVRHPFMALQNVLRIYWQALKLFVKGVPFLGKSGQGQRA
ncbi:DUF1365 domain-containing protein [Agaribacterium haliotis]|uniref:DUF1365 domain-containing protein n=1 Tax=Agaribacterium haliotis TaxID=2013869 RepID=UPI001303FD16|nr:DUF1365 domain-containing protein [Agaribacterium haliotis]